MNINKIASLNEHISENDKNIKMLQIISHD